MKRDYSDGINENITFYIGTEIEHTRAHGLKTLFVVGLQDVKIIEQHAKTYECSHIFFGASWSFDGKNLTEWRDMLEYFLRNSYLVTLDVKSRFIQECYLLNLISHEKFIPQICVAIPNVKRWGNAYIKIDDFDFRASNEGVWTHPLQSLLTDDVMTMWDEYKNDTIIRGD